MAATLPSPIIPSGGAKLPDGHFTPNSHHIAELNREQGNKDVGAALEVARIVTDLHKDHPLPTAAEFRAYAEEVWKWVQE